MRSGRFMTVLFFVLFRLSMSFKIIPDFIGKIAKLYKDILYNVKIILYNKM